MEQEKKSVTGTLEIIKRIGKEKYLHLEETLEKLTDEEVNKQPFPSKKTIGEIISHLIMTESLPVFALKTFLRIVGKLNSSSKRPIDASDFIWRTDTGKIRKPREYRQHILLQKFKEFRQKKVDQLDNLTEKNSKFMHIRVRHVSKHLKQIFIILKHSNS